MSTTISDDLKLTWTVATPVHNCDAFEGGASYRVARLTSFEKRCDWDYRDGMTSMSNHKVRMIIKKAKIQLNLAKI